MACGCAQFKTPRADSMSRRCAGTPLDARRRGAVPRRPHPPTPKHTTHAARPGATPRAARAFDPTGHKPKSGRRDPGSRRPPQATRPKPPAAAGARARATNAKAADDGDACARRSGPNRRPKGFRLHTSEPQQCTHDPLPACRAKRGAAGACRGGGRARRLRRERRRRWRFGPCMHHAARGAWAPWSTTARRRPVSYLQHPIHATRAHTGAALPGLPCAKAEPRAPHAAACPAWQRPPPTAAIWSFENAAGRRSGLLQGECDMWRRITQESLIPLAAARAVRRQPQSGGAPGRDSTAPGAARRSARPWAARACHAACAGAHAAPPPLCCQFGGLAALCSPLGARRRPAGQNAARARRAPRRRGGARRGAQMARRAARGRPGQS